MPLPSRTATWRRCGYLLGVAASLCAYLLTAFGFPVYVPRAAKDGQSTASSQVTRPCGCVVDEAAPKACCCCSSGGASCCGGEAAKPPKADAPADVTWVLGEDVLRCQGLSTAWVAAGAVLPPPALDWRPTEFCADLPALPAALSVHVLAAPPAPPPRSL